MRYALHIFLVLAGSCLFAAAADSDDPLLDAKMELAEMRAKYTEVHPKYIAAKEHVEALSKTMAAVTPAPELRDADSLVVPESWF